MTARQLAVHFVWGLAGVRSVAEGEGTVVVVDVLRFATAVEAAVTRGAFVHPVAWESGSAPTGTRLGSLSPVEMLGMEAGDHVALRSPNGATCSVEAGRRSGVVVAACLRNHERVASWLIDAPGPITVVSCGELWGDGSLRPSIEDLLGAGAVIEGLRQAGLTCSAEAMSAADSWRGAESSWAGRVRSSMSALELLERGAGADLEYALADARSAVVPVLRDGVFAAAPSGSTAPGVR